jgi:hypothetical protein
MASNDGTAPWMELVKTDFVRTIRGLKVGRNSRSLTHSELHLGMIWEEAVFTVNSAEGRCPARGHWPGLACFNAGVAYTYTRIQPRGKRMLLRFADDRLHIESSSVPATWIEAPAMVTTLALEAHFIGPTTTPEPSSEYFRYCPRCGKAGAVLLASLPIKARLSNIEKLLHAMRDEDVATHGCFACGHGWLESLSNPPAQGLTG